MDRSSPTRLFSVYEPDQDSWIVLDQTMEQVQSTLIESLELAIALLKLEEPPPRPDTEFLVDKEIPEPLRSLGRRYGARTHQTGDINRALMRAWRAFERLSFPLEHLQDLTTATKAWHELRGREETERADLFARLKEYGINSFHLGDPESPLERPPRH
jgi:hypothetical protein